MAEGPAQMPFFASRPAASAASSAAAHVLVGNVCGGERLALRQQARLHRVVFIRDEDKGGLAAVTIRRVVIAAQGDVATGDEAASAAVRLAASVETGSMPASLMSRPSARRKLRASVIAATRPSPCG